MVFFVHGPRVSALFVTRTRNRFTPLVWWYCQDAPVYRRTSVPPLRSADFQVGCIADFQIREPGIVQVALEFWCLADLEIGDTAGLETCATRTVSGCAARVLHRQKELSFGERFSYL